MDKVNAIVLRAAGVNCDEETLYALQLAGAAAQRIHINRVIENLSLLDKYQICVFPGGFSYGDDVSAGKILANQIIHHVCQALKKFIEDGKLVLGICNGFQVLVKTGILPGTHPGESGELPVTITDNDSGKFEDRWVYLEPASDRCVFIEPGRRIYLPVAHGEGKVVTKDQKVLEEIKSGRYVAFRYVDKDGNTGPFPVNPNGSADSIAGLTDSTGRILGLMPHPERHIHRTQHPHWRRLNDGEGADGSNIFENAVKYVKQNL